MSNINLNISFNPKVLIAILAVIGVATYAYKIPETKAQSSSAISGKFGCVSNTNATPYLESKTGQDAWMNNLAYLDFDARSGSVTESVLSNFNSMGTSQRNVITNNVSFTVTSGPITGSSKVTFLGGGEIALMPVNSGNTLLWISFQTGRDHMTNTGVCQRI
jgi:hypothetical protein